MRELPLGWRTDLSILTMSGARVTDFEDYVLVESPGNPGYHWGNCILVTSGDLAGDPPRCLRTFQAHLPSADHIAIGLPAAPSPDDWRPFGVQIESTESLMRHAPLPPGALPPEYDVRQLLNEDDWALRCARLRGFRTSRERRTSATHRRRGGCVLRGLRRCGAGG
jgi:hypothetical protein